MKIKLNLLFTLIIPAIAIIACSSGNNSNGNSPNNTAPHVTNNKVWTDQVCSKINSGYASKWTGLANDTQINNAEICSDWYPSGKSTLQANKSVISASVQNVSLTAGSLLESYTVIANGIGGANWIHFGMKLIANESDFLDAHINSSTNLQWSESQIPLDVISKLNIPYGNLGSIFITPTKANSSINLTGVYDSYYPNNAKSNYLLESMNWNGTSAATWNQTTKTSNYPFANLPPTTANRYQMSNESINMIGIPSLSGGQTYLLTVAVYLWQQEIIVPISILITSINSGGQQITVAKLYSAYLANPGNLAESSVVNPLGCTYSTLGGQESQNSTMTCQYPNSSLIYKFNLNNLFTNLLAYQKTNSSESTTLACEQSNAANGCSQNGWVLDYSAIYPNNYPTGSYLNTCANIEYNSIESPGFISAICWSGLKYYDGVNYGYTSTYTTASSLNYNKECALGSQVSSTSGNLSCDSYSGGYNYPSGPYTQNCDNISYESGVLSAICPTGKATLDFQKWCAESSQVLYLNDTLACANYNPAQFPPQFIVNGQTTINSYLSAGSCFNMTYESGILKATCLGATNLATGQTAWVNNTFNYTDAESGCQPGSALYLIANTGSTNYDSAGSFLCESPAVGWVQTVAAHYTSSLRSCTLVINYSNNGGGSFGAVAVSPFVYAEDVYPVYPNVAGGNLASPVSLYVTCTMASGMNGIVSNTCNFDPLYSLNYEGPSLYVYGVDSINTSQTTTVIQSFGYQPVTITTELEDCLATSFPSN